MARDGAVGAAGARSLSPGIAIAGDRTTLRAAARRHTQHVKLLKHALPIAAVCVGSLYGLSVLRTLGTGMASLPIPAILPENLAMQNPHYEGYSKDGGKYWVKAERAQQELGNLNLVKLTGISGEITDGNRQRTTLAAARGTFDVDTHVLELYDSIDVAGDTGISARLTRASVQTKENIITSNEPVAVAMTAGRITSQRMTAQQKSKTYAFIDAVKAQFKARGDANPNPAAAPLIGQSTGPIDVNANRLDVDDARKIAVFSGAVTASQDGATLATPELEVHYDGAATEKGGKGGGGSVTRLIAKDPVTVKQANGDTVASRNADFDPASKRALFSGDVVMQQSPDKRVTADTADLDQAANTIVLTGAVGVTQGGNRLAGQRLVFNRQTNQMQLTAPSAAPGGGRISARFTQNGGVRQPEAAAESNRQGIAFGATFKTDPNAPIDIEAARLDVDDSVKRAVFTGAVRAVQGDFVLLAAELTAAYSGSAALGGRDGEKRPAAQLSKIRAQSKVEVTSKDGQKATGDWAEFDPKANTAVLGGNVVLMQGENIVRGTKLVIDMNTGESVIKTEAVARPGRPTIGADGAATAESAPSGRPSAVFYPGKLKANIGKTGAQALDGWQTRAKP